MWHQFVGGGGEVESRTVGEESAGGVVEVKRACGEVKKKRGGQVEG